MYGVSSKIGYTLLVILCFLMLPVQQLDAQPMWGEEGTIPIWFKHIDAGRGTPIVRYPGNRHGVYLEVYDTVPGAEAGNHVELLFDEDGVFVDTVRYPACTYGSRIHTVYGLENYQRLIAVSDFGPNRAGVVRQAADGTVIWQWLTDEITRPVYEHERHKTILHVSNDYVAYIYILYQNISAKIVWLDLETGDYVNGVEIDYANAYCFDSQIIGDSLYVAINNNNGLVEAVMPVGETDYSLRTIDDVAVSSILNYYNDLLIRYYWIDNGSVTDIYDRQDNELISDVSDRRYGYYNGANYYCTNSRLTKYNITRNGISYAWHANSSSINSYEVDSTGIVFIYNAIGHEMSCIDVQGNTRWIIENENIKYILNKHCIQDYYLYTYDGDRQFKYNMTSGECVGEETNLYYDNLRCLDDWYLVPSGQEHSWIVFTERKYEYDSEVYENSIAVKCLTGDNEIPRNEYFRDTLYFYENTYLTPTSEGGLWIITPYGQTCLDRNGSPIFQDIETPFEFKRICYLDPSSGYAPYPMLYRKRQNGSYDEFCFAWLDNSGDLANEPVTLCSVPSYYFFPYEHHLKDVVRNEGDYFLYSLPVHYGSCLGFFDSMRGQNTTVDTLCEGAGIDVYKNNSSFYSVLYRVTSTPLYSDSCFGQLVLRHSRLDTVEHREEVLLDSIRGNAWYYYHFYGITDMFQARAYFSNDLLYTLSLDSGLAWQVRQFSLEGDLLHGPTTLAASPSDTVVAFLEADSMGCWAVIGQKTYLLDSTLTLHEEYEQGISFTSWRNIVYDNAQVVTTSEDNLVVAGNADHYMITAQSFRGYGELGVNPTEPQSTMPTGFTLATPWPNPFNSTTRLRYSLPHAGEVRLAVYDILGREVRVLANATQQAGQYEVHWDGCSDAGIGVASGVYFVRAELGEQQLVRKVTLVK